MSAVYALDELIAQTRRATDADLHYLALFAVLALPDICGALGSDNGQATASKYKDWIRANVPEYATQADLIYGLRCSLLHQGRALPQGTPFPLAFTLHQTGSALHQVATVVDGAQVLWLHLPDFVGEVTRAAERWLDQFGSTKTVLSNLEKFARLRPEGFPRHVHGVVVA